MSNRMTVGQRIRQARKEAKLTQTELGAKIGVSGSMIGQYENGLRNPKCDTLSRIATALGIPSACLAGTMLGSWISVKERLPQFHKETLVVCDGKIYTAENMLTWEDGHTTIYIHALGEYREFSHWMPLPELPKEE